MFQQASEPKVGSVEDVELSGDELVSTHAVGRRAHPEGREHSGKEPRYAENRKLMLNKGQHGEKSDK
jgi:hypothetical protein